MLNGSTIAWFTNDWEVSSQQLHGEWWQGVVLTASTLRSHDCAGLWISLRRPAPSRDQRGDKNLKVWDRGFSPTAPQTVGVLTYFTCCLRPMRHPVDWQYVRQIYVLKAERKLRISLVVCGTKNELMLLYHSVKTKLYTAFLYLKVQLYLYNLFCPRYISSNLSDSLRNAGELHLFGCWLSGSSWPFV